MRWDAAIAGGYDYTDLRLASEEVGRALATSLARRLVVVRSTATPRTTRGVVIPALERAAGKRAGVGFGVVYNPDWLYFSPCLSALLRREPKHLRKWALRFGIAGCLRLKHGNRCQEETMLQNQNRFNGAVLIVAVSYTHLTLPTSDLV